MVDVNKPKEGFDDALVEPAYKLIDLADAHNIDVVIIVQKSSPAGTRFHWRADLHTLKSMCSDLAKTIAMEEYKLRSTVIAPHEQN